MPNWCNNTLTVSGNKKSIKRFREQGISKNDDIDTQLSLAKFVPEPDYTDIKVRPTFPGISKSKDEFVDPSRSWWDWRVQNWGTKWDVDAYVNEESTEHIQYCFASAWSPPEDWLEKVADQYKDLYFKMVYREDGCAFMGSIEIENGEVIDNNQVDTSAVWDELVKEEFSEDDEELMEEYMSRLDAMEGSL